MSRRLMLYVLLCGVVFTLATTLLFALREFENVKAVKRTDTELIRSGYLGPVASSLYKMDLEQLTLELESLLRLTSVTGVGVKDQLGGGYSNTLGTLADGGGSVERFPLSIERGGQKVAIGVLEVGFTEEKFLEGFWTNLGKILLAAVGLGVLVAAVFYSVLNKMLVNPLLEISDFAQRLDLSDIGAKLSLSRGRHDRDELDIVAESLNVMRERIESDLVERNRQAEALRLSENRLSFALIAAHSGIWDWNLLTGEIFFDDNYYRLSGYEPGSFPPDFEEWSARVHPDDLPAARQAIEAYLSGKAQDFVIEFRFRRADGSWMWILGQGKVFAFDAQGKPTRFTGTHTDITALKKAEEEKTQLKEQLLQAQKLESIGKLAGGVAHDFNNMLNVILGHSEMLLDKLGPHEAAREDVQEIEQAAKRSADLTRQLLAFARKQTIVPKVLDLNQTLEPMLSMIKRLIGEDIELAWNAGHGLWRVKIDRSQLDQIVANLATNARDAISGVGHVTIETANRAIDAAYAQQYPGFAPGDYVALTFADDGCGIEADKLPNIFEPFFTTKELGKGTGLGLSTVYGIVKQNGGFIDVRSEPRLGTTFRIFLPRAHEAQSAETAAQGECTKGSETILIVEDEPSNLELLRRYLLSQGYRVFAAKDPREALEAVKEIGRLDLLVTDVVMPGMNGNQLAQELMLRQPGLRCLYMSGYTANVIAHRGVLDEGISFIQKPYSLKDLAAKVRTLLDLDRRG